MRSPLTKMIFQFSAIFFVDDTDSIEMANEGETWEDLIERAQRGLDLWELLQQKTAGIIKHIWKDGKTTLDNNKEDTSLTVQIPAGTREELKQMTANEAQETLGVWQMPNGSEKIQAEKLQPKIKKWSDNISNSTINRQNARWAAKTTIGKTIWYPLAATTLDKKQCKELDKN